MMSWSTSKLVNLVLTAVVPTFMLVTPSAVFVWAGSGAGVPGGMFEPLVSFMAWQLEIFGVCWNSAFTSGGLGDSVFLVCFMLGEVVSGIGCLSTLARVFGGAGIACECFLSSESTFIGLGDVPCLSPVSFKFGAGGIVGGGLTTQCLLES